MIFVDRCARTALFAVLAAGISASHLDAQDSSASLPRPDSLRFVRARLPVSFAFTGDINLGTITLSDGLPPDSGRGLFAAVDSLLTGDLVVGNFEGVLADSGVSQKCGPPPDSTATDSLPAEQRPASWHPAKHVAKAPERKLCYAFATPTHLARRLTEAGFTHLNLANNHANDFGSIARARTDSVLRALGLRTYGPLGQISIDTLRSGDSITVIGLLGFATYPFAYDLLDQRRSAEVVDSVRHLVDVLVITFHGGTEGSSAIRLGEGKEFLGKEPRGDLRRWAHAVIDAGADAVIGHGPHVLRGAEFYHGKPVFYSLGNFATYRGFNLSGPLGLSAILRLELQGNGAFRSARYMPLRQLPLVGPAPDSTKASLALLRRVTRLDFPKTGARIGKDGIISRH